jgi:hypothetical protein
MARFSDRDDDADLVSPVSVEPADGEEDVLDLGGRQAAPSWLIGLGIGALVAGVIAVAAVKQADHHRSAAPLATLPLESPATLAPLNAAGDVVDIGPATALDLAMSKTQLYVLTSNPSRLAQVDSRSGITTLQVGAPPGAEHVYADPSGRMAWVVADNVVYAFDGRTLEGAGQIELSRRVSTAAALDGRLYIATDHGVYEMTAPPYYTAASASARLLPGYSGQVVQALAADPSRHRLLAVTSSYVLLEVSTRGVRLIRQLLTQLPQSIAVTRSGIWAVGFGIAGGSRIARIDRATLRITPVGSGDPEAPQGASGWPGADVFWVKDAYDDALTCRDGRSGAIVATLSGIEGPVLSAHGAAYAITAGQAFRLPTTRRCPG